MNRIRAVILDVDGTLIHSNDAHARAYIDAGEELGHKMEFEKVRRLIGMGGDKLLPRAAGLEEDSEEGEKVAERKKQIFKERYLPTLKPTPGARQLLHRLRDDGMKLVVATSAKKDEMGELLEQAEIADLIQDATSASDAEESKPNPDIVEAALEQAGFPVDQVVMIGDTPYDVEAATRAGVRIIAVRTGGWSDEDLGGAIAVYEDPRELLEQFDDSPLGRNG
ncbi:HAD family hydrolase [soil metagenome]|nr:HAD family hydrolase [Gemmatimonadota bacterium]